MKVAAASSAKNNNKMVILTQYLLLTRPLEQLPPKCETQCPGQLSIPALNFSQIHSTVAEEMCDKQTDKQQT